MARNGLVVARCLSKTKASHNVTNKAEQDVLVVRKQQLPWITDCKTVAGEDVTTEHVCCVVQKRKEAKTVDPKAIK